MIETQEAVRGEDHEGRERLMSELTSICLDAYNGENSAEIATILKDLHRRFQGSVDIDRARRQDTWGGNPVELVEHPITGEKFNIYFTSDGQQVKVPIET